VAVGIAVHVAVIILIRVVIGHVGPIVIRVDPGVLEMNDVTVRNSKRKSPDTGHPSLESSSSPKHTDNEANVQNVRIPI
jgi:hypothetical protein